ncbi:MAG: haloacid dehalogenase superfamily protein [Bacteroidetes bacterium]|nr:MAG: haloacid dehalogenase superfamily protein [Bacteroidota bacterium]
MIQAVIFDMDGLLVDSEPWWRVAETNVFGQLSRAPGEADFERMMGNRIQEVIKQWYQRHPWENADFETVQDRIIGEVDRLVKENTGLLPGVGNCIRFFEERKIPVALASSSPYRLIESLMRHYGLYDRFSLVCSAENEPFGKPHPAVFLTAAHNMQTDPLHTLVFEDSFNGVIAAKAARMKCVAVPAAEAQGQTRFDAADLKLRSLEDWDELSWKKLSS